MKCWHIIYRSQNWLIALLLAACANQPQNGTPATAGLAPGVRDTEECSMLGRLAYGAVSVVSGDAGAERRGTCTAYRAANGSRVETCGSVAANAPESLSGKPPVSRPPAAVLGQNTLRWSDNSNNESNFVIERCDQVKEGENPKKPSCAGVWKQIGTVGSNVTQYVDTTAIVNRTYLYRVKAMNGGGSSAYSNDAVITTPPR